MIEGLDMRDPSIRQLDQCRIGPVLLNDPYDLAGGPPVTAMIVQNTNPASVAPDQTKVKQGLAREDLFVCVHEQFMTETAQLADIVLPATMFLEHDDIYQGGGHQHIMLGRKLVEPPGECRNNHEVICDLAGRVGAEHPGFAMTPARDHRLDAARIRTGPTSPPSKRTTGSTCSRISRPRISSTASAIRTASIRFKPDWKQTRFKAGHRALRSGRRHAGDCPITGTVIEEATEAYPFRLATSPARTFLNSTFNETPSSRKREGRPDRLRPSRRSGAARHRRRRQGQARQRPGRGDAACQGLRRRAPRRAGRRIDLAERGLRGRAGASTR